MYAPRILPIARSPTFQTLTIMSMVLIIISHQLSLSTASAAYHFLDLKFSKQTIMSLVIIIISHQLSLSRVRMLQIVLRITFSTHLGLGTLDKNKTSATMSMHCAMMMTAILSSFCLFYLIRLVLT